MLTSRPTRRALSAAAATALFMMAGLHRPRSRAMDAQANAYEPPEAKNRHDSAASGAVLASILLSVLCGVLVL